MLSESLRTYMEDLATRLGKTDFEQLGKISDAILKTAYTGRRIYTCGNGGSAATASHICNDLIKGCRVYGRPGFTCQCLSDSQAVLTCLSNDFSYEDVFYYQLQTSAKPGDLLLAISGSGNSENVIRAAKYGKSIGMTILGLTGRDGGKLLPLCDAAVVAPTDCMEQIEDIHMAYLHGIVSVVREKLKDSWGAEILKPATGRHFKAAVVDFDGTLNRIMIGWRYVMLDVFTEILAEAGNGIPYETAKEICREFINRGSGAPTILQCRDLAAAVKAHGGTPKEAEEYKDIYWKRNMAKVSGILEAIRSGEMAPEQQMVIGGREFINALQSRGIPCGIASGTDEKVVVEEVELLGMTGLFELGVFGDHPEQRYNPKEHLVRKLIADGIRPEEILVVGDGCFEMKLARELGCYALGVATDDASLVRQDEWKRQFLIESGADMIIPDFENLHALLKLLNIN